MIAYDTSGSVLPPNIMQPKHNAVPASHVLVKARFDNAANQLVAVSAGGGLLGRTASGQRIPFILELYIAPNGITRTDLAVSASPDAPEDYRPLMVVSRQIRNPVARASECMARDFPPHYLDPLPLDITQIG
jgi:hypothetical protein